MFTALNHFQPRMLTNSRKNMPVNLGRMGSVVQRNKPNIVFQIWGSDIGLPQSKSVNGNGCKKFVPTVRRNGRSECYNGSHNMTRTYIHNAVLDGKIPGGGTTYYPTFVSVSKTRHNMLQGFYD
eukprot:868536-Pyramimonas_sp.AAC.1